MPTEFKVSFPGLGIYQLEISRIAFELQLFGHNLTIYWYGVLYATGFLVALVLALRQADRFNLSKDDILDVFLVTIPLSVVGSRLYYVAFSWDQYADNLWRILDLRDGGLAFYGGVLAGILALYLIGRAKQIRLRHLMDFFAPYLALGQAIGRWGNFFNQEAFGTYTELPWGMISEGTQHYLESIQYPYANSPVHPTFLYESLGNIVIFIILLRVRAKSKFPGETTAWYLALYGLLRYFVEGLRTDSLFFAYSGLRVSQLLSLIMFLAGLAYLLVAYQRVRKSPAENLSAFARPAGTTDSANPEDPAEDKEKHS